MVKPIRGYPPIDLAMSTDAVILDRDPEAELTVTDLDGKQVIVVNSHN